MITTLPSKMGKCEVCEQEKKISVHYGNMWFCDECWAVEYKGEHMSPENQQKRVDAYKSSLEGTVLTISRQVNEAIEVRQDVFNAKTEAIVDLKKAIDANPEISNKPYALAEELIKQFNHFKQVIFDANEVIVDAGNSQKAIQVYLNQMANTLRAEEREKLKIADINYKPTPPKATKTVKSIKTTQTSPKTKLDKAEVRKYAAELGVSEFTLYMVCTSGNLTPEQAANKLRKSINEAKSEAE